MADNEDEKQQKLTVRLPTWLHWAAKVKAAQERTTLTEIVRKALEEFVRGEEDK